MLLRIAGTITAATPILITRPDQGAEMLTWVRIVNGTPIRLPVLPGATLKGKLRAVAWMTVIAAAKVYDPAFTAIDLDRVIEQASGGREFKGGYLDLTSEKPIRDRHPLLSLFGAASTCDTQAKLEGKLEIHAADAEAVAGGDYPDVSLVGGTRRDPFAANPDLAETLSEADRRSHMAQLRATGVASEARGKVKDAESILRRAQRQSGIPAEDMKRLEAELVAAKANLATAEADPAFKNALGRPIPARPAVPAGTVFAHQIVSRDLTDIEAGFLLTILKSLPTIAAEGRIGGGRTTGYGHFHATYTIERFESESGLPHDGRMVPVGSIIMDGTGNPARIETQDAAILIALEAWREAEKTITSSFDMLKPIAPAKGAA